MSCAVCGRDQRGYGYGRPKSIDPFSKGQIWSACSIRCLDIIYVRGGDVFNLTHFEKQGIDAASAAAGEYLEQIGKTDLATMTPEEWNSLLSLIFVKTAAEIQRLSDENAVPF